MSTGPFSPRLRVVLDLARGGFVVNDTLLPGAHATVAKLLSRSRSPASARNSARGMAGIGVGRTVHAQLEQFFSGHPPAANEHPLATNLRAALAPYMRGAATHPEMLVAAPRLGFATSIDLVAISRGRAVVVEYKTGYLATFNTASAGAWRKSVAPAFAAARIDCTPGGLATVQAFLGALAFAATHDVPLEQITVIVARAWAVGPNVCTAIHAHALSEPANRAAAEAIAAFLERQYKNGRRPRGRAGVRVCDRKRPE